MEIRHFDNTIIYEAAEEGIRITGITGNDPQIILPDRIDGIPVTEIGRYCFSESSILSICLPSCVRTLHNGAFYNCRKLEILSCGTDITGIGSDVFTNCTRLHQIIVRGDAGQSTGLRLILERLPDDLTVVFQGSSKDVRLFFPEYYEWLDEITPAHLFSRSIHGEGYRMRKCFSNRILDPAKYDQCFGRAITSESDRAICRIGLNRLLYPYGLSSEFRQLYKTEISGRISSCYALAVEKQSMSLLQYICTELSPDTNALTEAYDMALQEEWGEGCAYLTAERHRLTKARNYEIDWNL